MSHAGEAPAHHQRPRWQWWFLLVVTVLALALGTVGFMQFDCVGDADFVFPHVPADPHGPSIGDGGSSISQAGPGDGADRDKLARAQFCAWLGDGRASYLSVSHVLSALYKSLQLFLLHTPHFDRELPVAAEAARWMAALVFFWTVGGALWRVYAMEWRYFRLGFIRDHVVICGAGWGGLPLAREARNPGTSAHNLHERLGGQVIVIDPDPDAPGLRVCRRLGIPSIVGDPTQAQVLRIARADRARMLVVATPSDSVNIEIARNALHLVDAQRTQADALRCIVQIDNPDLRMLARKQDLLPGNPRIEFFAVGFALCESGARWLFQAHPLDWVPVGEESPAQVHLVVLGFGEMGECVLLQAARMAHLANGRRLRVTVVDRQAADREADFRNRHPGIDEVCELRFVAQRVQDPAVVEILRQLADDPRVVLTCAICTAPDAFNLGLALRIDDALKSPRIRIRFRQSSSFALGLLLPQERQASVFRERVRPFGMVEELCNWEALEHSELDALARRIHQAYVDAQRARGVVAAADPALASWEELTEDLKESNRHAADHVAVKLRALAATASARAEEDPAGRGLSDANRQMLARMEHARFCAERLLAGWRFAPETKDVWLKTTPTLVPWEELPESERMKDFQQIASVLELAGWSR